jgi:Zn-dependent M16 (insulinase) family peptidase
MHLTICGNIELIKDNWQIIDEFINECKTKSQQEFQYNQIKEKQISLHSPATIIGSPHEESGYILRWARVPIHPSDFVPLLIFSNYLDIENGPLWTACRTNGYSYGVAFDFDFESNLILLSINQCSQLNLAYSSAIETLKNLIENQTQIDFKRIHAAQNLTICMLTEHLATLGRVIGVCIRSYLNTYSIEKYRNLLNEIYLFDFTKEVLVKMIENYVKPIINENQSSTLILINTNKMKETQSFLQKEHAISNVILIKDVVKHLCR